MWPKPRPRPRTKLWYADCAEMRDAAADVNKSLHAGDSDATAAAMDKLQQSCEDCHKVFKPE